MISTISIHTQNLIKEIKEREDKERELTTYSEFMDTLTDEHNMIIMLLDDGYNKYNELYVNLHISESEDLNLSEDIQAEIKKYDDIRGKYYFKMMDYKGRLNMIRTMYDAYLDKQIKKEE